MTMLTTRDGVELYYKDWGPRDGQPVVFCHGWPLNSDSWEGQMLFLAEHGYRCIAHDRRGHGRSSQPWDGNDMDHYADDLAQLIDKLDLKNAVLVGFSTGGGEVARYVGRNGTARVARLALVSAVPPQMLRTAGNPGGLPMNVFDGTQSHRTQAPPMPSESTSVTCPPCCAATNAASYPAGPPPMITIRVIDPLLAC